ncbi:glycosyltransferase [Saccharibacillus sacchari]|uniref:Glycosyltransferase n=1 Tax=Saccharibacillus sacchari TaxID=456493 RepID=A0ACC6P723_9BACL
MRKIVLASEGSNGDLLPILAIGQRLMKSGNQITICAPPNNEKFVKSLGFEFIPIGIDFQALLTEHADKIMGKNPIRIMRLTISILKEQVQRHIKDLIRVTKDADMLIASGLIYAAKSVAEYRQIPFKLSIAIPQVLPSNEYAPLLVNSLNNPPWLNRFLWWGEGVFQNRILLNTLNEERRKLALQPIKDIRFHLLNDLIIPADPLLQKVKTYPQYNYMQTGYWHLEEAEIEPSVCEFIEKGSPPIFIGFGSSTDPNSLQTKAMLNEVIQKSGHRFIISKGWADLGVGLENENVKIIDFAPYLKMFPKMVAVIHHGGAGTTHCAARSGVPQIIVPHAMDQYRWGDTIVKKKLGSSPIPRSKLTAEKLLQAIEQVTTDETIKRESKRVGELMQREDGIEQFLEGISFK